ncbi:MAG: hypothetical protein R6U98_03355, partial [Pirellulaceae bacterium]
MLFSPVFASINHISLVTQYRSPPDYLINGRVPAIRNPRGRGVPVYIEEAGLDSDTRSGRFQLK